MSMKFLMVSLACCCMSLLHAENVLEGLSAQQILEGARSMFPREEMEIVGDLVTAEERGMNETSYPYSLTLDWSKESPTSQCTLYTSDAKGSKVFLEATLTRKGTKSTVVLRTEDGEETQLKRFNVPIAESDLTWMDLTLDYLWWQDATILDEAALAKENLSNRVNGRNCMVLEVRPPEVTPGCTAVRLWIDLGTGNLLQAAQSSNGKTLREMWVQRIGRENGRWVPRLFNIRTTGLRRKTSLYIHQILSDSFSVEKEINDEK